MALRVDFHTHTRYSKDSLTSIPGFVKAARRAGLDRVVVSDHNTIAGALEAHRLAPDLVIVGEEILTTQGEILAAYVREEIPAGLEPAEVIRRLRQQGAFISVSHPFDLYRSGYWEAPDLEQILSQVDAIEIFNSRCMLQSQNDLARDFAERHDIPGTAGSDAHTAREIGRAVMIMPEFSDASSLRRSVQQVEIEALLSSPAIHFSSRCAVMVKGLQEKLRRTTG